jgi:hypothetical protein
VYRRYPGVNSFATGVAVDEMLRYGAQATDRLTKETPGVAVDESAR